MIKKYLGFYKMRKSSWPTGLASCCGQTFQPELCMEMVQSYAQKYCTKFAAGNLDKRGNF